jgi:hypothetical protein
LTSTRNMHLFTEPVINIYTMHILIATFRSLPQI